MVNLRNITFGTATLLFLASAAFANEAPGPSVGSTQITNTQPKTGEAEEQVSDVGVAAGNYALALRLAGEAQASGDAILMLAAARLAAANDLGPGEGDVRTTREPAAAPDPQMPKNAEEMLAAAADLAAGDADLTALIKRSQAELSKGEGQFAAAGQFSSTSGAGTYDIFVPGYDAVLIVEEFWGGEVAIVELYADNPYADIDLEVYDEFGNLVCLSDSYGNYERCRWTPRWTGVFYIYAENYNHAQGSWAYVTVN